MNARVYKVETWLILFATNFSTVQDIVNLSCMYTSVLDKEGIFTEEILSVNSFVNATSNNGCNSKNNIKRNKDF